MTHSLQQGQQACSNTPLFRLGQCVITMGVHDLICQGIVNPYGLLWRHQCGDWGDLDRSDQMLNQRGVHSGGRLMSAYTVNGHRLWVITEWDRSVTTLLLPSEY